MKSLFDLEEQQRLWLDRIFNALASKTRLLIVRTLQQLDKPISLAQLKKESNLQHFSWRLFLSHIQILVDARIVKLSGVANDKKENIVELTPLGKNFIERLEETVREALSKAISL